MRIFTLMSTQLPRCDLTPPSPILRANDWGHPYRLTEEPPPYDTTPESVHGIIKWLGVEKGARWRPKPGTTYCNVYATDFSHALGVYLPRVWWSPASEVALAGGGQTKPVYGKTVVELSANALFRWLAGPHASTFGWQRTDSFTDAQHAANAGLPVVLCARKKVEASPGHIAVVAPETGTVIARRDGKGAVELPVISQAGARNEELAVSTPWWCSPDMAEWGLWIHDPACV